MTTNNVISIMGGVYLLFSVAAIDDKTWISHMRTAMGCRYMTCFIIGFDDEIDRRDRDFAACVYGWTPPIGSDPITNETETFVCPIIVFAGPEYHMMAIDT